MQNYYGRRLLKSEIGSNMIHESHIISDGFTKDSKGIYRCTRCGTKEQAKKFYQPCLQCKNSCYYCNHCIQMGKVSRCSKLYYVPESNHFPKQENPNTWKGVLSKQQAEASEEIVLAVHNNETRLIWAVAGAGKTEIVFEGIAVAISNQKRVCFASPRVDVCLEIAPRLAQAFNKTSQCVLYGGMEEEYQYTQLVVATTHQLLRFYHAFDVLIIDEIDAFPYTVDKSLHYAANHARKTDSTLLYLTATPDHILQQKVRRKEMDCSILPGRYHGFPLPIPSLKWVGNWKKELSKNQLNTTLKKELTQILHQKQPLLIFLPHIAYMRQLEKIIKQNFPSHHIASVYAADPDRKEKVLHMRQGKLDILLSTTILERGVTFTDVQVIVFGAEDRTFTSASLIQIAGRVGRKTEYPSGKVLFLHHGKTKGMIDCVREIKKMNHLARQRGLLK